MSKVRWIGVVAAMLLSVGLDFASATFSVMSDAIIIGAAIYLLWPAMKEDIK